MTLANLAFSYDYCSTAEDVDEAPLEVTRSGILGLRNEAIIIERLLDERIFPIQPTVAANVAAAQATAKPWIKKSRKDMKMHIAVSKAISLTACSVGLASILTYLNAAASGKEDAIFGLAAATIVSAMVAAMSYALARELRRP